MKTTKEVFENHYSMKRVKHPISFGEVKHAGWTLFEFCEYCALCEEIRSAIILSNDDLVFSGFEKIKAFFANKNCKVMDLEDDVFSYIILSDWSLYGSVINSENLPKIYRTSKDLRRLLECFLFTGNLRGFDENIFCETYDDYCVFFDGEAYELSELNEIVEEIKEKRLFYSEEFEKISKDIDAIDDESQLVKKLRIYERVGFIINLIDDTIESIEQNIAAKLPAEPTSEPYVLYVHKGNIVCLRNNHNIENVTVTLKTKGEQSIEINAQYCNDCNNYFIEYSVFEHYRKKFRYIIGDLQMVNSKGEFGNIEFERMEYHPIRLCGYTVSQQEGLGDTDRRYILAEYIGHDDKKKQEVIRHLTMLIETNGHQKKNEIAVGKWISDREFVLSYDLKIQRTAVLDYIKKYNKEEYLKRKSKSPVGSMLDFDWIDTRISNHWPKNLKGRRIKHRNPEYGKGTVVGVNGNNVLIKFDNETNKSIVKTFDLKLCIEKNILELI